MTQIRFGVRSSGTNSHLPDSLSLAKYKPAAWAKELHVRSIFGQLKLKVFCSHQF